MLDLNFFKNTAFRSVSVSGILLGTLMLSGCGESAPPPPTGRVELVARFFKSIENNDVEAAMRQGVKLRSLDVHNENIVRLVEIQQCNSYINAAQKRINANDISGAVKILQQGVKQYPDNVALREMLPKVRQLRNAKALIMGMEQATGSIAMRSALTAAKVGLYVNSTPALEKYFSSYELRIKETEKKERTAQTKAASRKKKPEQPVRPEPEIPAIKKSAK